MKVGITSIQRDRNPYIIEWVAFHLCMGFTDFFIYAHKCTDAMSDTLKKLAQHYPIIVKEIDDDAPPQLKIYWESINEHVANIDWMAFIDGDEFLMPMQHASIGEALASYQDKPISALGVYWMCYGSSGHLTEPQGLVTENFTRHAPANFAVNRHAKTILKGRNTQHIHTVAAHIFDTNNGTFDEQMRPIATGWEHAHEPSHSVFRINHYLTQSYDFYRYKKRFMGAADVNANLERDASWWTGHDRNDCDDGIRYSFLIKLKLKIEEIEQKLALNKKTFNKPTATYDISRMTYKG